MTGPAAILSAFNFLPLVDRIRIGPAFGFPDYSGSYATLCFRVARILNVKEAKLRRTKRGKYYIAYPHFEGIKGCRGWNYVAPAGRKVRERINREIIELAVPVIELAREEKAAKRSERSGKGPA